MRAFCFILLGIPSNIYVRTFVYTLPRGNGEYLDTDNLDVSGTRETLHPQESWFLLSKISLGAKR